MSRTTVVTALAIAGLLAAGAGPALAHIEVLRTAPGQGRTASTKITRASVTFTQQIRSGTLRVTGPDGRTVSTGKGARDPRNVARIAVGLRSGLRAGAYRARWSMVAADGHKQAGSFSFRLRKP